LQTEIYKNKTIYLKEEERAEHLTNSVYRQKDLSRNNKSELKQSNSYRERNTITLEDTKSELESFNSTLVAPKIDYKAIVDEMIAMTGVY
jgi:hypothetical protein